jgi:hypothetical protein
MPFKQQTRWRFSLDKSSVESGDRPKARTMEEKAINS